MSTLNIWTAASEGDLARVSHLIENEGISPNVQDENFYSPLHAAASWSHVDLLRYLVQKGGDINLVDDDGETCLFVVETAEMARVVVDLGVEITHRNKEGLTAAENLAEEYPHISLYLRSIIDPSFSTHTPTHPVLPSESSSMTPDTSSQPTIDASTDALMSRVREIMEASERGEFSPEETDDRLRVVVEEAIQGQVDAGRIIGEAMEDGPEQDGLGRRTRNDDAIDDMNGEVPSPKRAREEPEGR